MEKNQLYYGDNLDVLRRYIKPESVDLVYLDPPFKSNQDYNVLFAEKDGSGAAAQFKAFEDTWSWDQAAAAQYQELVEQGDRRVSEVMQAFRLFLGTNDMLAYLTMMAPRLVELRRVLKSTGSIYLRCDPTASHYLKLLMDAIFGPLYFRNEIIWKRSDAHSDAKQGAKHYGRIHDVMLFFGKSNSPMFQALYLPLPETTIEKWYRNVEPGTGRRFNKADVTGPGGAAKGNAYYEWKGVKRYWRYSRESMEELEAQGRLTYSKSGMVYEKRYLDESKGVVLQDIWTDVQMLRGIRQSGERLGYPTQKPEALLERIMQVSSKKGDLVLDPFCGCGTTIAVAQRLKRRWIGIDITHLAMGLIKKRLRDAFGPEVQKTYEVIGEPVSFPDAEKLAKEDPYQFQWWALGLVGARRAEQKKGADQGIDGRLYFHPTENAKAELIVISVKSGHVTAGDVRDLRGVIEREKAAIGVFITLEDATKPMRTEAASAGFYKSPWGSHPKLQILTVAELLEGKGIDYPHPMNVTFKRAPKSLPPAAEQLPLAAPSSAPAKPKKRKPRPS